eukprot:scaffold25507_cov36-Prasinocladus_malaysianus.AAC.1
MVGFSMASCFYALCSSLYLHFSPDGSNGTVNSFSRIDDMMMDGMGCRTSTRSATPRSSRDDGTGLPYERRELSPDEMILFSSFEHRFPIFLRHDCAYYR